MENQAQAARKHADLRLLQQEMHMKQEAMKEVGPLRYTISELRQQEELSARKYEAAESNVHVRRINNDICSCLGADINLTL